MEEEKRRLMLAMPEDVAAAVETIAKRERRSLTAQIVYFLERGIKADRAESTTQHQDTKNQTPVPPAM